MSGWKNASHVPVSAPRGLSYTPSSDADEVKQRVGNKSAVYDYDAIARGAERLRDGGA